MTDQAQPLRPVKIGLIGLGTVGSGTFQVLTRNAEEIARRAGRKIEIAHIGARSNKNNLDLGGIKVSSDVAAVVRDPEIDIVVELIGGTTLARELVMEAIRNGKHVVTANKALIAEFGNEIFEAANQRGVDVAFEAAVAGGIPIIKAIREGLAANQIQSLAGIINGTGNFILTEMRDKGRAFEDVLKEAQALGYAEADPTFDVEGIDAAHKLIILASIAFGMPLKFDGAYTEGITRITTEDVAYAEELGYRIKHLGIARRSARGVELRVHPTLIPERQLIANVDGVMNAVLVQGDAVGSTLYYGAGAGAEPTASSVIADIIAVARALTVDPEHKVPHLAFQPTELEDIPVLPASEFSSAYYLRLTVEDKPGVLAQVTGILSEQSINIQAVLQKEAAGEAVPVIILTQQVCEKDMDEAIARIQQMPEVKQAIMRIRVEEFAS